MTLVELFTNGSPASFVAIAIVILGVVAFVAYKKKDKSESTNVNVQALVEPEIALKKLPQADATNDYELVAAITAAISAMTGESTDRFVVRSIRRVATAQSPWNVAAKREQHINI